MGLQYLVADKVKRQQYKLHSQIKMDDMCALLVGESGHFTSTSTMVRHHRIKKIFGNAAILSYANERNRCIALHRTLRSLFCNTTC